MMLHKVIDIRHLTESTSVIRFTRNELVFRPGQHILAGIEPRNTFREYSIYSGVNDPYLEILVRQVIGGQLSKAFTTLQPGDTLQIDGPMGFFTINEQYSENSKYCFIATGTGIAPFHSMIKSQPSIDYRLIHGVKHETEQYEKYEYHPERYISCLSSDKNGSYNGRVTDYLKASPLYVEALYYLCGNCNMIHDVYDLLTQSGVNQCNIHTEVYF